MKNIAIIGASGAIGSAFLKHLETRDDVVNIYAFSRTKITPISEKISYGFIDVTDEETIKRATEKVSTGPLDLIIFAVGILHEGSLMPEKSLRDITIQKFNRVLAVNTVGPALVMKYFLPLLNHDKKSIFAALSARVGSISDNHLGGWYAYRASKAALNMLIKTASLEMKRTHKHAIIVGLHPGTVDSSLSKPFQGNVAPDYLFTPDYSVCRLIKVLEELKPENSGRCFSYDGQEVLP